MSLSENTLSFDDLHPIDIVENLAEHHDWQFDRVADDQIAMAVEGQWRTYSITLAWTGHDETLRMICTFDLDPPAERLPRLHDVLNRMNDHCWAGAFSFWEDQRLMVYRYGLILAGGQMASVDQITTMIETAVLSAERFYPAMQLVAWSDETPTQAMQMAIADAYGRA